MLGSGKSSLNIWTSFDTASTAGTRNPLHELKIAWTRVKNPSLSFFTIGTSIIGGLDIIQGQLNVITENDKFTYFDETERAIGLHYDRVAQEPLGGLINTIGDVTLDNTTKRFTPNVSDTIGTALKRGRPLKMFMGFKVNGQNKTLPTLYGLTEDPKEDKRSRVTSIGVFDYISYINDYELETTMFTTQRSDQIISSLLQTVGFTTDQFSLDTGLNTIGFAWFKKGDKAGDAIRKIAEAEEGRFFQDEEGLLRFENRTTFQSKQTVNWNIGQEDVLSWETDNSVPIINRAIVKAQPRVVQSITEIWKEGTTAQVGAGESKVIWASFENPATSITDPVTIIDYVANTESDGSGSDITSDISIVVSKFVETTKLTITNANASDAHMTLLRLRGTPATISSKIEEIYENRDSEENFGRHQLVIENDFIDTESFAFYLARSLVERYADPLARLKIKIAGAPQLQVLDVAKVTDPDTTQTAHYRIMRISGDMTPTQFHQDLVLRRITAAERNTFFVIGTSTIDGLDVIG